LPPKESVTHSRIKHSGTEEVTTENKCIINIEL